MKILAHIVNPVAVPETSDLRVAQPVTFESMRVARRMAEDRVHVRQLVTCYPEDAEAAPSDFDSAGLLERSVLDVGEFAEPRKLPLLCDILGRLHAATEGADYMIYTNVDIALMPSFYLTVSGLIDDGFDAFVINRRTITDRYTDPTDLSLMYAQAGDPHPGHDCFVFRRDAFPSYRLGLVCVGAPWVGRVLLLNLIAFADRFEEFKDLHATFHIGDAQVWQGDRFADLARFNRAEATEVLDGLERRFEPSESDPALAGYLQKTRKLFEDKRSVSATRGRRLRRRAKRAWRGWRAT